MNDRYDRRFTLESMLEAIGMGNGAKLDHYMLLDPQSREWPPRSLVMRPRGFETTWEKRIPLEDDDEAELRIAVVWPGSDADGRDFGAYTSTAYFRLIPAPHKDMAYAGIKAIDTGPTYADAVKRSILKLQRLMGADPVFRRVAGLLPA